MSTTETAPPAGTTGATLDEVVQSRAAERRARERAATKRAILDAATALFAEAGAEDVSMRQVAAAAGYTATTIYNYFDDKVDLLHHVVLDGFGAFGSRLREAAEGEEGAAERYVAIGLAYVRFALEHPYHYRLMFIEEPDLLGREAPEGYVPPIESFRVLERVVAEGVEAGVLPAHVDPSVLAMATWTQVHGVASLAIATAQLDEDDALVVQETAGRAMLRGLWAQAHEEGAGPAGSVPGAGRVSVPRG